jgi:general secretion pathway protein K
MTMRATRITRTRGVALIAVLWIVASLALIVSSIAQATKQEMRAVSNARQAASAEALGQAAIHMVLQDVAQRGEKPRRIFHIGATFRSIEVQVRVQPLDGFIDLNNAQPGLLALLFQHAGGLEKRRAELLAADAVRYRSTRDARDRVIGFEAVEDLLQLPGVDYPLYARLSPLVTADLRGGGRVNATAAAPDVLAVLAGGNAGRATGSAGLDTTALAAEFTDAGGSSRYLLQARVPLGNGGWLVASRTVDFAAAREGVPWRTLHTDYRFEPAPPPAPGT